MPRWEFDEVSASSVRKEVTQGDQFNNDEVGLAEALVREAIQNSSDAALDGQVAKVRFTVRTIAGPVRDRLVDQMDSLLPHLVACDVDLSPLDHEAIRVLTIEDFNTRGLMGKRDDVDKGDFDRFWRAVGDSGKKGKAGGRWGLGKLVYSSASRLKLFYGLTVSTDDSHACLLGQAVLENHRIGDTFYPTHGFFLDGRLCGQGSPASPLSFPGFWMESRKSPSSPALWPTITFPFSPASWWSRLEMLSLIARTFWRLPLRRKPSTTYRSTL
jgi:hypothetical protein